VAVRFRRWASFAALAAIAGPLSWPVTGSSRQLTASAVGVPEWLQTVNAYRASAGVAPIVDDPSMQNGVNKHLAYLAATGSFLHRQDPGHPLYTTLGSATAQQSLLTGWKGLDRPQRQLVEDLLIGPFHAVHLLEPRLQRAAWASVHASPDTVLTSAAVVSVGGIGKKVALREPVLFPGRNAVVPFTTRIPETPDPITACPGYPANAGFPILAMFPTAPSAVTATLETNGVPLEVCVVDRSYTNPSLAAQQIGRILLTQKNGVILVPKNPFVVGNSYNVSISAGSAGNATWTFSIGKPDTPLPTANPSVVASLAKAPTATKRK
jgi:hypothetical protein